MTAVSFWQGAVQHDCGEGLVDGLGSEGVAGVGDRDGGEGHEMEQGVVSPSDSVVSENSAWNSLVRLGKQSVRRASSA